MLVGRIYRKALIGVGGNRTFLRVAYLLWRAFPYPLRRRVTALFIGYVLWQKRALGWEQQDEITPTKDLGGLAYWGVPKIDLATYQLSIDGAVAQAQSFSFTQLQARPAVSEPVRMDCVGGFRNNSIMKGIRVKDLLDQAEVNPDAQRAVFHCADGYYTSIELTDLINRQAFLAYSVNGESLDKFGFPLRLAVPGKYGYQWAKWVVRIELVTDKRKGYWPELGLPDRGDVGDRW